MIALAEQTCEKNRECSASARTQTRSIPPEDARTTPCNVCDGDKKELHFVKALVVEEPPCFAERSRVKILTIRPAYPTSEDLWTRNREIAAGMHDLLSTIELDEPL